MSCTCQTLSTTPTGEPLPLLSDDCPVTDLTDLTQCCTDPESLPSAISDGATLPAWATDAGCYDTGVTLLGRVGNKLARLVGSGFLQITNGQAAIVPSVAIKIKSLWHRWWKTTPTSRPIVGEPLAFPYHAVVDSNGDIHAIKGTTEDDSQHLWDASANAWITVPVSQLPSCVEDVLPAASRIELVGYTPLGINDPLTLQRCRKALSGAGLVFLVEGPTVGTVDCQNVPVARTVSVADSLEFPTPVSTEVYALKYSDALGLHWAEEP